MKATFKDITYEVNERLAFYKISQPVSENIEFYGHNGKDSLFVQFRSGSTYFYNNVTGDMIEQIEKEEINASFLKSIHTADTEKYKQKMIIPFKED